MTYTPEELQAAIGPEQIDKARQVIAREVGWADGPVTEALLRGFAPILADAVLPGYTRRIRAETLNDAADGIVPGEHSCFKPWCPECAVRADRQRQKDSLKRRAAALAAPVEPEAKDAGWHVGPPLAAPQPAHAPGCLGLHTSDEPCQGHAAPPVEQPPTQEKRP